LSMVNVICIKWGELYGPQYVNRLYAMVKRNLTLEHRFVCLTDDQTGLSSEIEVLPIPEIYVQPDKDVSPWRKLALFSTSIGELQGKTLYLDLDIVIMDNIDCFFTYSDKFTIIENWTQKGRGIGNSSVYCFKIGEFSNVLEHFTENTKEVYEKYSNEQTYLSKHIGDIEFWPDEWCRSFKFHSIPKGLSRYILTPSPPKECRILVFHGHPNPNDAASGNYGSKLRKYFHPSPWIEEYWHE